MPKQYTAVITKSTVKSKITHPRMYQVVLINDDQTPMTFVVQLLVEVFGHSLDAASNITLEIDEKERGVAGVYYWEIAEQKVYEARAMISETEFPLKLIVEKI